MAVLAGLVGVGAWGNVERHAEAIATLNSDANSVPVVHTQVVKLSTTPPRIELTGSAQAFDAATLFARATGYISKRNVDIGDRVKEGQLLAQITAPELDHQIAQAEATLSQTEATLRQNQANADLAKDTWQRDKPLVEKGWETLQQGDVDKLGLQAQQATVGVAQSNIAAQQALIAGNFSLGNGARTFTVNDGPNLYDLQISAGVARNFVTNIYLGRSFRMDGKVPRLGADVPRWYGETVGFWDGDVLITWTSNIQGWTAHGAFEFSGKMQTIEIYTPTRDTGGHVAGFNHEAVFYDAEALVDLLAEDRDDEPDDVEGEEALHRALRNARPRTEKPALTNQFGAASVRP